MNVNKLLMVLLRMHDGGSVRVIWIGNDRVYDERVFGDIGMVREYLLAVRSLNGSKMAWRVYKSRGETLVLLRS